MWGRKLFARCRVEGIIGSTDITDDGFKHIAALTGLRELIVSYCRFSDKGAAMLRPLDKLEHLEMVKTRVTDAFAPVLASFKNLKKLTLDYTTISDKGAAEFKALQSLTELRLDSATITDASNETWKAMPSLKVLNLYHTLVTEKGHQELKTFLPSCRIVWDRESSMPNRRGS